MSDSPQVPTISVKKSDGSIVKMTLEEFRAYKAQLKPTGSIPAASPPISLKPNQVVTPDIAPQPPETSDTSLTVTNSEKIETTSDQGIPQNLPMVEESQELSTTTPTVVGNVIKNAEPPKPPVRFSRSQEPVTKIPTPMTKEDFTSLLEEETSSETHTKTSYTNESLTKTIVGSLPFSVSKEVQGRLESLVLSRVKDIRNDIQVKEYALLPVAQGGLGLSSEMVDQLIQELQKGIKNKPVSAPLPSSQMRLKPVLPAQAMASTSSVKKTDAQKILSSLIAEDKIQAQMLVKAQEQGNLQKLSSATRLDTGKVPMHDVTMPQRSMGPVDEMQGFSLVDFRRLGNTATASAEALMNKFQVLKNDSFLLFLSGKAAWFKSPLYQMYLKILETSLKMHKPISSIVVNDNENLRVDEVEQIARVSQSLNF